MFCNSRGKKKDRLEHLINLSVATETQIKLGFLKVNISH